MDHTCLEKQRHRKKEIRHWKQLQVSPARNILTLEAKNKVKRMVWIMFSVQSVLVKPGFWPEMHGYLYYSKTCTGVQVWKGVGRGSFINLTEMPGSKGTWGKRVSFWMSNCQGTSFLKMQTWNTIHKIFYGHSPQLGEESLDVLIPGPGKKRGRVSEIWLGRTTTVQWFTVMIFCLVL